MENNLIVKANDLIEARYDLSLNEQKIILYAVSKLDRERDNFNILILNVREFTQLLGTTQERYSEIRVIVERLMAKQVRIDTKEFNLVVNWVSSIQYIKDTGIIELEFSEKLAPYLLQLRSKFTRYQLKNILYLKNKYSVRMYELLKQYHNLGTRTFTVEEIKNILAINNKYDEFKDFNRYVLKIATDEINKHTDIIVSYTKNKIGRKIDSITFTIESKEDYSYIEFLNQTYNIKEFKERSGLKNENFNSKQTIELYEIAVDMMINDYKDENDLFEYIKINYLCMREKQGINNRFSYLKKALKEDYAAARSQIKFNFKYNNL